MPDPLRQRPKRELLTDTGNIENGGSEKVEKPIQEPEAKMPQTATSPTPIIPSPPLSIMTMPPGQPMTHDRRSKVPFEQRYKKENIQVDRRLLPYFYDFVSRGNSRVAVINEVLLKVLIEAGYPLDPQLLERPFSWDDVPRS